MSTKAESATETLRLERTLNATPERVYRAFTEPALLKQWHAPGDYAAESVEADVRVGGTYSITMKSPAGTEHTTRGTYQEVVPNERLVYTWRWQDEAHDVGETLVTIQLQPEGEATRLTLTHERFPNGKARESHQQGWTGCLDNFERRMTGD